MTLGLVALITAVLVSHLLDMKEKRGPVLLREDDYPKDNKEER